MSRGQSLVGGHSIFREMANDIEIIGGETYLGDVIWGEVIEFAVPQMTSPNDISPPMTSLFSPPAAMSWGDVIGRFPEYAS